MKIAAIDCPAGLAGTVPLAFSAAAAHATALAGADLVVWNPEALMAGPFEPAPAGQASSVLSPADSQALLGQTRAMREAFRALMDRGGTLVVLVPGADLPGVHTLQEVIAFDPLEALPTASVRRAPLATGGGAHAALDISAGEPFRSFFERCGRWLQPRSVLHRVTGRPIAVTPGGADVVATFEYCHPGRLILLPAVRRGLALDDWADLVAGLRALVRRLAPDSPGVAGPDWAVGEPPLGESPLRGQVLARREDLAAAIEALARAEREWLGWRRVAALEFGDSDEVAAALHAALPRWGAYAQPVEPNGVIAFEKGDRCGVFVVLDESAGPPGTALAAALAVVAAVSAELAVSVVPTAVFIGENAVPPSRRLGLPAAWAQAARAAGMHACSGRELLQSWLSGDERGLDALLAPAADGSTG